MGNKTYVYAIFSTTVTGMEKTDQRLWTTADVFFVCSHCYFVKVSVKLNRAIIIKKTLKFALNIYA